MSPLQRDIVQPLTGIIGARLTGVTYRPLRLECSVDQIADSDFYIGGEMLLRFDDSVVRYFSWAERAGFGSHFTLRVASESLFSDGALVDFDAIDAPLWKDIVGTRFEAADCLGWDDSPHVLRLVFSGAIRLIGSAYQTRFGDGDDLFFCGADDSVADLDGASLLWRSTNGEQDGAGQPATRSEFK
jgi:hypothetical protein